MSCIFCGADTKKPKKLYRLGGALYGLLWWCPECSGKCWNAKEFRFYGRQSVLTAKAVPSGCLFIPGDFKA